MVFTFGLGHELGVEFHKIGSAFGEVVAHGIPSFRTVLNHFGVAFGVFLLHACHVIFPALALRSLIFLGCGKFGIQSIYFGLKFC